MKASSMKQGASSLFKFDLADMLFFPGLFLIVGGFLMVYVPLALIIPGALFVAMALWRVRDGHSSKPR